jgi:geranylgeranyl transferase type-2 subunit alpha
MEVLGLITKLLNKNPEYYTIWNHRRHFLEVLLAAPSTDGPPTPNPGGEALINSELHLTRTLLREYPKCYWIWNPIGH